MSLQSSKRNLRINAQSALTKVLEPLVRFSIETGISVTEFESLLRQSAVRVVAARQVEKWGRVNVSGIAATTGLSRTEVTRVLKKSKSVPKAEPRSSQLTNRVLRAWHEDPSFTDSSGKPLALEIFGKELTFESLVRSYGRGVPVRALLDELIEADAVDIINSTVVRAKSSIAIHRGFQTKMLESFGSRAMELLYSMLENLRESGDPKFVATVEARNIPAESLSLIKREVANRGAVFLSNIEGSVFPDPKPLTSSRKGAKKELNRASVTIYYFDDANQSGNANKKAEKSPRRNFRRKSRPRLD